MVRDGRYRWTAGYALVGAAMAALHDLSAALVAAHLVAAVVAVGPKQRRFILRCNGIAGAAGLLLVSPLAWTTASIGQGASRFATLTPGHLLSTFVGLFSSVRPPCSASYCSC